MRLRVGVRNAALALLLCAAGASAEAAQSDLLLAYDVRYGGVTIMKLEARLDLAVGSDRSYAIAVEGRTVGLLDITPQHVHAAIVLLGHTPGKPNPGTAMQLDMYDGHVTLPPPA